MQTLILENFAWGENAKNSGKVPLKLVYAKGRMRQSTICLEV